MTTSEVVEYVPTSLDVLGSKRPEQVLRLKYDVAHIMESVLKGPTPEHPNGIHYGPSFPGSKKNSLLLPGAHTLSSTFGVTPRFLIHEIPEGKGRRYQITANMYSRSGLFLGEGIGEASTEEEKFAWEAVVCDAQYQAADPLDVRIKYKRNDSTQGYYEVQQIRTNPADRGNTILKIAKKRAFVDGIILVLDCSDIFDQDFEELGDELGLERVKDVEHAKDKKKPKEKPAPIFAYGKWKGSKITDPAVPVDYLQWFADSTQKKLADPARAKFKAQDQLFLAALDAEIAFRSEKHPQEPPQTTQDASKPATQGVAIPPKEEAGRKPFSDSAWADMIVVFEEEYYDRYQEAKAQFKVSSGHDVTDQAKRFAFYDFIMA